MNNETERQEQVPEKRAWRPTRNALIYESGGKRLYASGAALWIIALAIIVASATGLTLL